jgi:mono/diheme cytochrome c family protein
VSITGRWLPLRRLYAAVVLLAGLSTELRAHNPGANITWNREVSRIVYERCASCHRPGGTAFSLMAYQEAQPRAPAIKEAVLSRRMPPWGAVKGFGDFRNDQGLTQEQIELITDWVEGGAPRGNNPNALPAPPKFDSSSPRALPPKGVVVSGDVTIDHAITLDGLLPEKVPDGASMQIIARLPNGSIAPLLWLYEYRDIYRHPFLFRRPIELPPGTMIRGVQPGARLLLMSEQRAKPR